jgi:hypothetical protein
MEPVGYRAYYWAGIGVAAVKFGVELESLSVGDGDGKDGHAILEPVGNFCDLDVGMNPFKAAKVEDYATTLLAGSAASYIRVQDQRCLLTKVVTLDLFVSPRREHLREQVVRLRGKQREVAKRLSESAFQVDVQKALALHRMMQDRGLNSPYELLLEPPADYGKLRRHKNKRYKCRALEGYERPQI